jgi:hypothetical protein
MANETTKFEMRKLKTKDIFSMSKILKKMDIDIFAEGKDQSQLGVDLIMGVVENIGEAEVEFNAFFADLLNIKAEEFSNLEIEETLEVFDLFKNQGGIKSFLSLLKK